LRRKIAAIIRTVTPRLLQLIMTAKRSMSRSISRKVDLVKKMKRSSMKCDVKQ